MIKFKSEEDLLEYVKTCIIQVGEYYYITSQIKSTSPNAKVMRSAKDELSEIIWDKVIPKDEKGKVKQKKINNSYYFIPSKKDFSYKLAKFRKEYDYEDATIIQAVQKYVNEVYCASGDKLFRSLSNFISHKESGSLLAAYCDMINNGDVETTRSTMPNNNTLL